MGFLFSIASGVFTWQPYLFISVVYADSSDFYKVPCILHYTVATHKSNVGFQFRFSGGNPHVTRPNWVFVTVKSSDEWVIYSWWWHQISWLHLTQRWHCTIFSRKAKSSMVSHTSSGRAVMCDDTESCLHPSAEWRQTNPPPSPPRLQPILHLDLVAQWLMEDCPVLWGEGGGLINKHISLGFLRITWYYFINVISQLNPPWNKSTNNITFPQYLKGKC